MRIFRKKADATVYTPVAGDTLATIVDTQCEHADPKITVDEVALYNWGTKEPAEMARALVELLGVRTWSDPDPRKWELDPARGIGKTLLLPKVMEHPGLAYDKDHSLKVKQQLPATAVCITALDKWFLPSEESCDVSWQVEGVKTRAKRLDFDVYASNYCEATSTKTMEFVDFAFNPIPNVPIRQKSVSRRVKERSAGDIKDWKGESEATIGILKPRAPAPRHINAACSPYTVLLRYYDVSEHKKALLRVHSFWPRWKTVGGMREVDADSLKIKWFLKDAPAALQGQFLVFDKDAKIVWRQAIPTGKCGNGEQEIDWSADGKPLLNEDNMPYRVQIQLHTDKDTTPGFAVAAMHTEVRIFVDKDTHALDLDPYVPGTDKISVDLSIADWYHKDEDPDPARDGKLWTKFALAKAGFHPGPVSDGLTNAYFESALNELQRSVPEYPGVPGKFKRLALTAGGDDNAKTKAALQHLEHRRTRPIFGKPADRSDWADTVVNGVVTEAYRDQDAFKTSLRDPNGRMIVWVDDRNWYTDFAWIGAADNVNPSVRSLVTSDPADLGNLRGEFTAGDARVGYDARDVARPWIPLQADLRLLRKAHSLRDSVAAETDPGKAAAVRKLIGPLRIDWSFDEIEQTAPVNLTIGAAAAVLDLPVLDPEVDTVLSRLYHRERNRTRTALRFALDSVKVEHRRADIHKLSKYYNSPASSGGIRPTNPGLYFREAFGVDDDSMAPIKARGSALETIYTTVHDDLGQPEDQVFPKRLGRSAVYFHPSRIAGDGYQVRAQLRFEPEASYGFPNTEALGKRYPKLPQAQSTRFRLWRRSTVRGYVAWGPNNTWAAAAAPPRANLPPNGPDGFRDYYTCCHVHLSNELGLSNAELDFAPTALFKQSDYRQLVKQCLVANDERRGKFWQRRSRWITVGATFWPWSGHKYFGITEGSTANISQLNGFQELNTNIIDPLWYKYAVNVSLAMVKEIERRYGLMRGHVIVEYQTTPDAYHRRYQCKRCEDVFTFLQNATGPIRSGERCRTPGCGDKVLSPGRLRPVPRYLGHYVCNTDPTHTFGPADELSGNAPGIWTGMACPICTVPSQIDLAQVRSEKYRCSKCDFEGWYPEPGLAVARGSHQNQACPCLCGGQLKSRREALAQRPHIEILDTVDATRLAYQSGGVPTTGLPSTSLGNPVGVSLNFLGDSDLWGHELAHCRHHEHSGNAAAAAFPSPEHDSVVNSTVNWADPSINETEVSNQGWERACLMAYTTDLATYDGAKDMPCFCHRCVLKNRGWRLHDVTVPLPVIAGDLQDP